MQQHLTQCSISNTDATCHVCPSLTKAGVALQVWHPVDDSQRSKCKEYWHQASYDGMRLILPLGVADVRP